MISVAVCAQENVHFLDLLLRVGAFGIAHDPRVNDKSLSTRGLDPEGSVAEPCELDAFEIHVRFQLLASLLVVSTDRSAFRYKTLRGRITDVADWLSAEC